MAKESSPRLLVEPTAPAAAKPGPTRAERREFDRRVVRAAVIVNVVLVVTIVTALLIWRLRALVLLVVVSLFLAAMLHPIVSWVQRMGLRRNPPRPFNRVLATCTVFLLGIVVFGAFIALISDPVISQATRFADNLPKLVSQAQHGRGQVGHLVKRFHLLHFVNSHQANLQTVISKLSKPALAIGKTVLSGLVSVVTIAFLTLFLVIELPHLVRGVLDWMHPERATRVHDILDHVSSAVVGYVLGNLLTSIIAGLVVGISLYILGVPYAQVLGVWVAIVDFLPMIGGLLAGVPTVIVAALHSLTAGIIMLVIFLVYQEVENHFLNPLVMSRTVKLNPLWVLLAVLIGAELGALVGSVFGGLVGALIAVPAAASLQVVGRDLWQHRTGASLLDLPPTAAEVLTAPLSSSSPLTPVEPVAPADPTRPNPPG